MCLVERLCIASKSSTAAMSMRSLWFLMRKMSECWEATSSERSFSALVSVRLSIEWAAVRFVAVRKVSLRSLQDWLFFFLDRVLR